MLRLLLFLIGILLAATGLAWLADRPGSLLITWEGYEIETSVFRAVVILAVVVALVMLAWSIARQIWTSPAAVSHFLTRRRQRRGLDALSSGMIAIGAGDQATATRYALQARKSLPNEPMTHLLRAQAAQLTGDRATARRIYEAMLASPDTELLGLRGLYLEATREGETVAARQFADRASQLAPKLGWPLEALFDLQCKAGDWGAAADTLLLSKRSGHTDKDTADRQRAILITARAQAIEESDAETALALASEAHGLAPGLIPAAAIAGRILAARGQTSRAAKIIEKTWAKYPHPDLAIAYAYARIGDSPRDRLKRVQRLAQMRPYDVESAIAIASAAIEADDFATARGALEPFTDERLTRRVARLMARIAGEEQGDVGRVREWLARAAVAGRDPAWTADGVVLEDWSPVSPVSGRLDAVEWRVPVSGPEADRDALEERVEHWLSIARQQPAEPEAARTIDAAPMDGATVTAAEDGSSIKHEPAAPSSLVAEPVHEGAVQPEAAHGGGGEAGEPIPSPSNMAVVGDHGTVADTLSNAETISSSDLNSDAKPRTRSVSEPAPESASVETGEAGPQRVSVQSAPVNDDDWRSEPSALRGGKTTSRSKRGAAPDRKSAPAIAREGELRQGGDGSVPIAVLPIQPDDPGEEGEILVPEIRTSRTGPAR